MGKAKGKKGRRQQDSSDDDDFVDPIQAALAAGAQEKLPIVRPGMAAVDVVADRAQAVLGEHTTGGREEELHSLCHLGHR